MSDWTQGVVLVTGANARSHGSGFVIERTGDVAHVVTCDHVVADLGEPLQVYGCDAAVVWRGSEAGVDLAILAVDGLEVDALPIGGTAAKGSDVVAMGWATIDRGQAAEPCHGTIESITQLTYGKPRPHAAYRIAVAPPIQDGYSGGPVIDVATGAVIAVITLRTKEGHAHAIAIRELQRWRPTAKTTTERVPSTPPLAEVALPAAIPQPKRERAVSEWVTKLGATDALVAVRAALALEAHPNAPELAVSAPAGGAASLWARRYLIERAPTQVATYLVGRVNAGNWSDALAAGELLTAGMGDQLAPLVEMVKFGYEKVALQASLHALGHACLWSTADVIDRMLARSHDDFDYRGWGVDAMVRIFLGQTSAPFALVAGHALWNTAKRLAPVDPTILSTAIDAQRTNAAVADALLAEWIDDATVEIRRFAITKLGLGGFARVINPIAARLSDASVADAAQVAPARIGTDQAAFHVRLQSRREPTALALALPYLVHDPHRAELVDEALASKALSLAVRAVGLLFRHGNPPPTVRDRVFGALSADSTTRGFAALAIARIFGVSEQARLQRAAAEASTPIEIVFTALALCVAGASYRSIAGKLRANVADIGYYEPCVRDDVIYTLEATRDPEAVALTEALALVNGHGDLERTRAAVMALGPP